MAEAVETCRGLVNTWECDENDHYNVQFYIARKSDAEAHFRAALGFAPISRPHDEWVIETSEDHIRYVGELLTADSLIIHSSVVGLGESDARIFHEMRNEATGELSATFVSKWQKRSPGSESIPWTESERRDLERHLNDLPSHAHKRSAGLEPAPMHVALSEAMDKLIPIYKGVVLTAQCDRSGVMKPQFFVARFSDGSAHLWNRIGLDWATLQKRRQGSVVVESCLHYAQSLQADDLVSVFSQLLDVGPKTIRFRHFVFNATTGALAVAADMTAILMDLDARKATEIPRENRAIIESLITEI